MKSGTGSASRSCSGGQGADLGTILQGQEVTLVEDAGQFVIVRDLDGRVGYILADSVATTRPSIVAGTPFTDCHQATSDQDVRVCEARAEDQWDSCGNTCAHSGATAKCSDSCRVEFKSCLAACHGESPRPEPAPAPVPVPAPRVVSPPMPSHPAAAAHKAPKSPKKPDKHHHR